MCVLSYIIANKDVEPFLDVNFMVNMYICYFCWVPTTTTTTTTTTTQYVNTTTTTTETTPSTTTETTTTSTTTTTVTLPPYPGQKAPVTARALDALYWSNLTTWQVVALNGGNAYTAADGSIRLPNDNEDVKIPLDIYVVVDTDLPIIRHLQIDGILEFDNGRGHNLRVEMLYINGGQLIVGWENDPILTDVTISLTGTKSSAYKYTLPDGSTSIRSKSIGVLGGKHILFVIFFSPLEHFNSKESDSNVKKLS